MSEILIRRSRRKHRSFTIIDNQIIEHPTLSWEARMILIYLLSKPDNWRLMFADLVNRGNWGRDKTYRVVQELIDAGYIKKTDVREAGKFLRHEYIVFEDPVAERKQKKSKKPEEPLPENQEMVSGGTSTNTQDHPLPENQEVVEHSDKYVPHDTNLSDCENVTSPLPDLPDPVLPDPANPTLVNTEYKQILNRDSLSLASDDEPDLVTLDWVPSPELVKQISFNAGVTDTDVFNMAIGFAGHFNGQYVYNIPGELLKWVTREKAYRRKKRGS